MSRKKLEPVDCVCRRCKKKYVYKREDRKSNTKELCGSCYIILQRKKIKKFLVEYKGGQCIKCGYKKSINALEFHHRNPEEKVFTLGGNGSIKSLEKSKKEADKCDLVCSNCHREIEEEIVMAKYPDFFPAGNIK